MGRLTTIPLDLRKDQNVPAMVTFVVIAYNEELAIADCIRSILAQETEVEFEIVVVDDGSQDRTAEIVRDFQLRHPVRIVDLGQNRGRGAARFAGVEAATGSFIAMVDSDIVLPAGWLQTCLDEMAADPGCMAVGGVAVPDGDTAWVQKYTGWTPRVVPHGVAVTGSNGLYRREIFASVSFASRLRLGEDVAFNHELSERGIRTRSLPHLVARHNEHKSYLESLGWLYETGLDASRQLARFRRVRAVDGVSVLFWVSALTALPGGRGQALRRLAPASLVLASSTFHLNHKFTTLEHGPRVAVRGTVAYSSQVLAYFCGRLVGHLHSAFTHGSTDVFESSPGSAARSSEVDAVAVVPQASSQPEPAGEGTGRQPLWVSSRRGRTERPSRARRSSPWAMSISRGSPSQAIQN